MSVGYNPKVITDGLVLCLDAANSKSYNQAENLISDSEGLSTFSASRLTKTLIASGGPVNNNKYTILTVNDATGGQYLYETSSSIAAGDTVTQSWYVKDVDGLDQFNVKFWTGAGRAWTATREASFTLSTRTSTDSGNLITKSIQYISNGWYRLSITATADQAGTAIASLYISSVWPIGNKVYVSGAQLTKKIGTSVYTPTTGTAVTAATSFIDLISKSQSTFSGNTKLNTAAYNSAVFELNNNTTSSDGQIQVVTEDLNALALTQNFTVMFAAKKNYYGLAGNNNGNSQIFQGVSNGYNTGWRLLESSQGTPGAAFTGKQSFTIGYNDINTGLTISDSATTNRMCICAFSISPSTIFGFVNGVTGSRTNPNTYASGTSTPRISFTSAGAGSWNGLLGFFMIYNRALSLSEITQNYNALGIRFGI